MKTFREFNLTGEYENLINFKNDVVNYIDGEWQKQNINEKLLKECVAIEYCGKQLNKAIVYLCLIESEIKITNIIPIEKTELTYEEYNEILLKCINECIILHIDKYNLSYVLTNENVDLEDYMSDETARKLRQFSSAVNRNMPHPLDMRRWYEFIYQAFIDGHENVTSILEKWLTEKDNWDYTSAVECVIRFEYGISLLKFYNNKININ